MKLEDQVVSLELAKKLKELGIKQDSLWWWVLVNGGKIIVDSEDNIDRYQTHTGQFKMIASAFTVAELGEMLPRGYNQEKLWISGDWVGRQSSWVQADSSSEANLRAAILVYLIEQGKIDVEKLAETEAEAEA